MSIDAWLWGDWHSGDVGDNSVSRPGDLAVTSPLRKRRNLAAEEFTYLRACTDRQIKITLPSPTLFANLWSPERSSGAYPTLDDFMADVTAILRDEVRRAGAAGLHVHPARRAALSAADRPGLAGVLRGARLAARAVAVPRDRARQRGDRGRRGRRRSASTCAAAISSAAGWSRAATSRSPGRCSAAIAADRLLLEYDDERSGSFDALSLVPDDKVIVLGLVTTKTSRVEPEAELAARLADAARRTGAERLAVSPQCGFATSAAGNAITPEAQRAKLALLVKLAADYLPG